MANWISLTAVLLVVFLILVNDVDISAGRGRGGRSRIRRSRYSRSSSSSSKPYKGTYGYTSSTWVSAFRWGAVYGGPQYLRSNRYLHHRDKMPTICKNIYKYDENGTNFNLFVCPQQNDPDNLEYCCGEKYREYCCAFSDSPWRVIVTAVVFSTFALIFGAVMFCLFKSRIRNCCKGNGCVPDAPRPKPPEMNYAPPPYSEIYTTPTSADPEWPTKATIV